MTNKTIGIICAMAKEMNHYKEIFHSFDVKKIMGFSFCEGTYNDNKIVFSECGIGKVNAGILTTLMIEHYHPDFIINTGVAGGFDKNLKTFDVVVADRVFYHDADCRLADDIPYGQIQGLPMYFLADIILNKKISETNGNIYIGAIASGDEFVKDYNRMENKINEYFKDVNVLACDMESGAIAHACYLQGVPFTIIRSISDIVGGNQIIDYSKFTIEASNLAAKIVIDLIETEE